MVVETNPLTFLKLKGEEAGLVEKNLLKESFRE